MPNAEGSTTILPACVREWPSSGDITINQPQSILRQRYNTEPQRIRTENRIRRSPAGDERALLVPATARRPAPLDCAPPVLLLPPSCLLHTRQSANFLLLLFRRFVYQSRRRTRQDNPVELHTKESGIKKRAQERDSIRNSERRMCSIWKAFLQRQ